MKRPFVVSIAFLVGFILVGCARDDMWYQKKVETYEKSDFFEDGIATRLPVEGTVIQGSLKDDSLLYEGMENGSPAARFPFPVTKEKLERGQDRYGHFCLPCHGATGDGLGMVVQRGFKQPSAFTAPHLMSATPGYLFLVLKVGYSEANGGTKLSGINTSEGKEDFVHPPLLKKMGAEDVWATIAYIRALQASQSAPASSLTPEQMEEVTNPKKELPVADIRPIGGLGKLSVVAMVAAIAGIALFVMGMNEPHAWKSFHFGFVAWSFFTCGCLAMVILINVTRGTWGYPLIRFFEAGAKLLPFMFLLALVMLAMKSQIYEWANPEIVSHSLNYQHKTAGYLSEFWFSVRTVIYFAFWSICAFVLIGLYKKEDQTGEEKFFKKRTVLAAPMAIFFVITLTGAATDWIMSLEEFWYSTIYGLLVTVGCALSAMAAGTLYLVSMWKREAYAHLLTVRQWRDMGNLLLTMVILWGYMSFSQYLIIWSGNLPEEIVYFVKRREGMWMFVGTALVFAHFLLPFFLLLSSRLKRTPWMLGTTVVFILVMRVVDLMFNMIPSMGRELQLTDLGAFLGIGGLWFIIFAQLLAKAEPTPRYSLLPKEAIEHA